MSSARQTVLLGVLGLAAVVGASFNTACSSDGAGTSGDAQNVTAGTTCPVTDVGTGTLANLATDDSPFARLVLANTSVACPTTFTDVLKTLDKVVPHPERRNVFAVDETANSPEAFGHRFVLSQDTGNAPIVGNGTGSAGDNTTRIWLAALEAPGAPSQPRTIAEDFIEVIAFSPSRQANVFYKFFDKKWHLMGDGTQANPATSGQDQKFFCRNCHATGALNFKELELPWNNWNSARFAMPKPANMAGTMKDLFAHVGDAYVLEKMISGGNRSLVAARISAIMAGKRKGESLKTLVRELMCDVGEPTLISSQAAMQKVALDNDDPAIVSVPLSFLAATGLPTNTQHEVDISRPLYKAGLVSSGQTVGGVAGDTLFAFFVPKRSFIDEQVGIALVDVKVLDDDTVIDILMTDFPNPVFSAQRCALADTVPEGVTNAASLRKVWIPILNASSKIGAKGLAKRLGATNDTPHHTKVVDDYLAKCEARGASKTEGPKLVTELLRLASQRRLAFVTEFPKINESPALIPKDKLGASANSLHMQPDCTVAATETDIKD